MTDLSITAASVLAGAGASIEHGTAGATVTAGQTVYKDSNTGKYVLCDANVVGAGVARGISLHGAANGQPLAIIKAGPLTVGAAVVAGTTYAVSNTAGGICTQATLTTGDQVCTIGPAISTTVINVDIEATGVTL